MKHLIFDTSNIIWRIATVKLSKNQKNYTRRFGVDTVENIHELSYEDQKAVLIKAILQKFISYYKTHKPDVVVATFEGINNWRKQYTKSNECISKLVYKANRVKTHIICISHPELEGDDVFAGYIQKFCVGEGHDVVGVSGDTDYVQLLRYPNFTLIDTKDGTERTLISECGVDDADYFMFEKAFRGDTGDNVMSAFPRIRKTKIQQAYTDDFTRNNIMNQTWKMTRLDENQVPHEYEVRVGDIYNENILLMDLQAQPKNIRELIDTTITNAFYEMGKYNTVSLIGFCSNKKIDSVYDFITKNSQMFMKNKSLTF